MKGAIILKGFIGIFLIISIPNWVQASDGKPLCKLKFNHSVINLSQSDTIPPPINNTETNNDKHDQVIIKEVPKVRRLPVPVPVIVKIKPVRIIKPRIKIITPLIKALH